MRCQARGWNEWEGPEVSVETEASGFFQAVYALVSSIPEGKVMTYGAIARALGNFRGARAVGWALRALPEGSSVPWHRVINSQGRISTRGRELSALLQRALLEEEGVQFDGQGRVDLEKYHWRMDGEGTQEGSQCG